MKHLYSLLGIAAAMIALASCSGESVEPVGPENQTNNNEKADSAVVLTKEIETRAIEQANQFSYKLFDAIIDDIDNLDNKNIFVSPLSVSMELSMLANGAAGETQDEIIKALGYDGVTTIDGVNLFNAKLLETLPNIDPQVKFTIANALWVNSLYTIKSTFSEKLSSSFNATIDNINFSDGQIEKVINDWVSLNTNGLINHIVDQINPDSQMILANALYFKANWASQTFVTSANFKFKNYDGQTSKVESMSKYDNIDYNSNDKCQIASFEFGEGNFTYTAILPNANVSIKDAVNSVTDELLDGMSKQNVAFYSPMFKFENKFELPKYMQELGVKLIFDENNADFSNMINGKISTRLYHDTSINLNDGGIEAAAVSYMIDPGCDADGPTVKYKELKLNRPFAFIIREKTTNAIIFVGAVNKL
jgi:serpin B